MRPKTFSEKWDTEERDLEKQHHYTTKVESFAHSWKHYMKWVIILIIIIIIIAVLARAF